MLNLAAKSLCSGFAIEKFSRPLKICVQQKLRRNFSSDYVNLSANEFDKVSEETLVNLTDYLDSLPDRVNCSSDFDVSYSMGVLTARMGPGVGTYVLNKQSPNRQLWLSSPISGPKRYDLHRSGQWVYKHDGVPLNKLLENELRTIFKTKNIDLSNFLAYINHK